MKPIKCSVDEIRQYADIKGMKMRTVSKAGGGVDVILYPATCLLTDVMALRTVARSIIKPGPDEYMYGSLYVFECPTPDSDPTNLWMTADEVGDRDADDWFTVGLSGCSIGERLIFVRVPAVEAFKDSKVFHYLDSLMEDSKDEPPKDPQPDIRVKRQPNGRYDVRVSLPVISASVHIVDVLPGECQHLTAP